MKFTKEFEFNCNDLKGKLFIKCNCQSENNNAEKNDCSQVETVKCDNTNCVIEINCNCESNCC
ncbi:MAG: hypothetical protein COA79_26240 [Planctomycetota bacterium]|nr:MAG: hypothetical protein COA79_26240 [Planctomycetota bacterium]